MKVIPYPIQKGVIHISEIARVRKDRGYSQAHLAKLSGVHRVSIARYETGKASPNLRTIEKLANALKVKVDDLIKKAG